MKRCSELPIIREIQIKTHIGQDGYHQEVYNYNMLESVWRKGKHLTLLVRMLIDTATMENNMVVPLKTKN